jgi:nonsense-mediated mRNA decay protein 3
MSEQLISTDTQNNTSILKYTISVEIAPICRDDLVCLPRKVAARHGQISQICIVSRVTSHVHLIDPYTLQTAEIETSTYWREPFSALASSPRRAVEFVVLDVALLEAKHGKWQLAEVEVARSSGACGGVVGDCDCTLRATRSRQYARVAHANAHTRAQTHTHALSLSLSLSR